MKELCKVSLTFTGSFIPCCYFDTQFLVVWKVSLTVGEIGKELTGDGGTSDCL